MKVSNFENQNFVLGQFFPLPNRKELNGPIRKLIQGRLPDMSSQFYFEPMSAAKEREWEQLFPLLKRILLSSESYDNRWKAIKELLASQAWINSHISKEHGGQGESFGLYHQVLDALFEISPMVAFKYMQDCFSGVFSILAEMKASETKDQVLDHLLDGSNIGLCAPGTSQSFDTYHVLALPSRDGQRFILDGYCEFVRDADQCSGFFVWAKTPATSTKKEGLSVFYVDHATPGVSIQPMQSLSIQELEGNFCIRFQKVELSKHRIIGGLGRGFDLFRKSMSCQLEGETLFLLKLLDESIRLEEQKVYRSKRESEDLNQKIEEFSKMKNIIHLFLSNEEIEDWEKLLLRFYFGEELHEFISKSFQKIPPQDLYRSRKLFELARVTKAIGLSGIELHCIESFIMREIFEDILRLQYEKSSYDFSFWERSNHKIQDKLNLLLERHSSANKIKIKSLGGGATPPKYMLTRLKKMSKTLDKRMGGFYRAEKRSQEWSYLALEDSSRILGAVSGMMDMMSLIYNHQDYSAGDLKKSFNDVYQGFLNSVKSMPKKWAADQFIEKPEGGTEQETGTAKPLSKEEQSSVELTS
jgi:hypothetical protein